MEGGVDLPVYVCPKSNPMIRSGVLSLSKAMLSFVFFDCIIPWYWMETEIRGI